MRCGSSPGRDAAMYRTGSSQLASAAAVSTASPAWSAAAATARGDRIIDSRIRLRCLDLSDARNIDSSLTRRSSSRPSSTSASRFACRCRDSTIEVSSRIAARALAGYACVKARTNFAPRLCPTRTGPTTPAWSPTASMSSTTSVAVYAAASRLLRPCPLRSMLTTRCRWPARCCAIGRMDRWSQPQP